jgi:23S rRNA (uracil1939-C5)-methyltransferase
VLRTLVEALSTPLTTVEVVVHEAEGDGEPGIVLAITARGSHAHGDRAIFAQLLEQVETVRGVFIHGPGWAWQTGTLTVPLRPLAGEAALDVPVTAFSQTNPAANTLLANEVLDAAQLTGDQRVLELYAGAGNFTVVLAPRAAALHAVERHRRAVKSLAATARERGWQHVTVEEAEVSQSLADLAGKDRSFDLVVADPPRAGMPNETSHIVRLAPSRVVYVSCDLPTLVRDLRVLIAGGYRLERVRPIDVFPQTYHIELVAVLERERPQG